MGFHDIQRPITNTESANRVNAASKIAQQQQIGRISAQQALQGGPQLAQQAGANTAQAQGQTAVAIAQADAQNKAIQVSNELKQQELQQQEQNIQSEETIRTRGVTQEDELSRLGRQYTQEILDKRRDFADYKAEAEFTDQQQNLDLARELQLGDIDLQDYQREVEQASDMDIAVMKATFDALSAQEVRLQQSASSQESRNSLERIAEYKRTLKNRLNSSQQKANKFGKQMKALSFAVDAGAKIAGAGA